MFFCAISSPGARLTLFLGGAIPKGAVFEVLDAAFAEVRPGPGMLLDRDVGNIIFDHGARCGVKRWSPAELEAEGDFFYDPVSRRVLLRMSEHPARRHRSIELALTRHIVDQSQRSWIVYEDLALMYGAAHGFGGGSTRGIVIRRCDISFIGGGLHQIRPDGRPVRYGNGIEFWCDAADHVVEECRIWEIYDAALTNQGSGTNRQENIVYRRNTIWNSEYSFEYWNRDTASVTRGIRFEYNTCVDAGRGWGHAQRPDPNGRHLMLFHNSARTEGVVIRRNIFARSSDSLLRLHGRDWTSALTMDENFWHQPRGEGAWWRDERVPAENLAEFLAARGFDRNSRFGDPELVGDPRAGWRARPDGTGADYGAGAKEVER